MYHTDVEPNGEHLNDQPEDCSVEALFKRYHEQLSLRLKAKGHQWADAEEGLQQAFIAYAKNGMDERIKTQEGAFGWLFVVANNRILDMHRRGKRFRAEFASDDVLRNIVAPDDTYDATYDDLADFLPQALQQLSDRDRLLLTDIDLNGRSQRQVAREIGYHEGSISRFRDDARGELYLLYRRVRPSRHAGSWFLRWVR
jgi:RNA polymerase sigma factor (sigma-70 family)